MKLHSKKTRLKILIYSFVLILLFLIWWNFAKIQKKFFDIYNFYNLNIVNKEKLIEENQKLKNELNRILAEKKLFIKNKNIFNDYKIEYKAFENLFLTSKNDKIDLGDKFYLGDSILVGEVVSVNDGVVKVQPYFKNNIKHNYLIIDGDKVVFKGLGEGQSLGLIKVDLPSELKISDKAILVLDGVDLGLIASFWKEDYSPQKTMREVYFKVPYNFNEVFRLNLKK